MLGFGNEKKWVMHLDALYSIYRMLVMWVAGNYPGAVADRPAEGPTQLKSRC